MRSVAAVATTSVVIALAGCSSAPERLAESPPPPTITDTGSASPASTQPSVKGLDVAGVKRALARTHKANSAHYEMQMSSSMQMGVISIRRVGSYDERAKVAKSELSYTADPEVARALRVGDVTKLRMQMVQTRDATYQNMPAWTGERRGKWLRHTAESLSAMFGEVEVDAGIVPPLLDVLAEARPTLAGPSTPDTAVVLVPAPAAFIAFPSSSPRKLIAKGLDPDKLTGDVQFEVHVNADGRIGMVRVEGDELFDQAFALVGEHSAIDLMSSVEAQITLSHYGEAVRVSVPPRSQVMTPDEFAAARG